MMWRQGSGQRTWFVCACVALSHPSCFEITSLRLYVHVLQLVPGVKAARMPCAKTVQGQIIGYLDKVGLKDKWDPENGCSTVDPEALLKLCMDASLQAQAAAQLKSGERNEDDKTIEIPEELVFNIIADAAGVQGSSTSERV